MGKWKKNDTYRIDIFWNKKVQQKYLYLDISMFFPHDLFMWNLFFIKIRSTYMGMYYFTNVSTKPVKISNLI